MSIRPHTLGYIFLLWMFLQLTRSPRWRDLLCVGGMFVLWANIHGSFVVGGLLLGTVGVWSVFAPWWYARRDPELAEDAKLWRRWWWCLMCLPLLVCLNPYGWRLWLMIWTFQREISGRPDPVVSPEWSAFSLHDSYGLFLVLLLGLLMLSWWAKRRDRWRWVLWCGAAAYMSFSNLRFVGLSFLMLAPLLAQHLSQIRKMWVSDAGWGVLMSGCVLLGGMAWSQAPRWRWAADMDEQPKAAMDFFARHPKLEARMFANLNPSGYIMFRMHRRIRVAYDGNPLAPGFWTWSQAFKKALLEPQEWERYCRKHHCDTVLLDLKRPLSMSLAAHLQKHPQ
ncbi:MAG: hypothetical protein AAGJ35_16300, partial [Myxococcota bacterium]